MKKYYSFLMVILFFCANAQQLPLNSQQQLENLAAEITEEPEDDEYNQTLGFFAKHPISINKAGKGELQQLRFLNEFQIESFLKYRRLLGAFIDLYELQAVPGWDLETIRRIIPYIIITHLFTVQQGRERLSEGEHQILFRLSRVLEKAAGYDTTKTNFYHGDRNHLVFRYRYQYKTKLYFGITADKDAGEQFFKGVQSAGFDFYSLHFFARDLGKLKALSIGDYQVNLGQGLILWQGQGFGKWGETAIKQQGSLVQPYRSFGENNFNRGGAMLWEMGKWQGLAFGSVRSISGNIEETTERVFTSFQASGLHRTAAEIEGRNKIRHTSFGGCLKFETEFFRFALNGTSHFFSIPFKKEQRPYNNFSFSGRELFLMSTDVSYTHQNMHLFGEFAADKNKAPAFLGGALFSLHPSADLSILYRYISPRFNSLFGNAFTENAQPVNEQGLYLGLNLRLNPHLRLYAYADFFRFLWLKYQVDAPARGFDQLLQLNYQPDKKIQLIVQYRNRNKPRNESGYQTIHFTVDDFRQNLRVHFNDQLNPTWSFKWRVEMNWVHSGEKAETGFLGYTEISCKIRRTTSWDIRFQYVETPGYDSRIYAYESDVLYSFSIPAFYGRGFRFYMNVDHDLNKYLTLSFRVSRTTQPETGIGSGLDLINKKTKTELKVQVIMNL